MLTPFANEPFLDFGIPANHQGMLNSIASCRAGFGAEYHSIIGGRTECTGDTFPTVNPSRHTEVIASIHAVRQDQASHAVEVAEKAFHWWKRVSVLDRAAYLLKVSAALKRRRLEMNALMILECGKTWIEADADTAEAIDFLEFYAREALRMDAGPGTTPFPGETNQVGYIPMGVAAVIPPWNFPCAILTGMAAAAIVCGNTVVVKPSPDGCAVAALVHTLFREAGLPEGVFNLVFGGPEAGEALVTHPLTRIISFTGSKLVGLRINELAARPGKGQRWIKRVIAEMGGKDTIIVDEHCDVEAAISGVFASAYGFAGQKCSACSRVVVHRSHYARVIDGLAGRIKAATLDASENPAATLGPVINQKAYARCQEYIGIGRDEGTLVAGGGTGDPAGWFVQPTLFQDVRPDGRMFLEEIFGPILAALPFDTFTEALHLANAGDYGLTGAVFSLNREHLARAREEFHVGNLYLNRKCTGALVDVQPFGGFNMSGTDSKAGGRDYLLHFQQAKSISERL